MEAVVHTKTTRMPVLGCALPTWTSLMYTGSDTRYGTHPGQLWFSFQINLCFGDHAYITPVHALFTLVTQLLSWQHWKTVPSDLVIVCMLVGKVALRGRLALLFWVWQWKYINAYTLMVKGKPNMECPHATMPGTALKTKLNTDSNVTQLKAASFYCSFKANVKVFQ